MSKFTRRFKRNKKNKSIKYYGGSDENINTNNQREGVFDIIGDKLGTVASSAINKLEDAGLKIAGLERINKHYDNSSSNIESTLNETASSAINNVNEVLNSEYVNNTVEQAAKDTADITSKLLDKFNTAMDNPIIKEKVEKAIENAGELGEVFVQSMEQPFNELVDVAAESIPKATASAMSGAVKVGTDALAAIPGVGGIIEVGKIINDGSKAASSVIEAGTNMIETASDFYLNTKENFDKGLKELEEKKKMGQQITNRTTRSINNFHNPINNVSSNYIGGKRKTKRRLFGRKIKSKRVRFSI